MHGGLGWGMHRLTSHYQRASLLMLMYAQSHILVNPSQYHHNVVELLISSAENAEENGENEVNLR